MYCRTEEIGRRKKGFGWKGGEGPMEKRMSVLRKEKRPTLGNSGPNELSLTERNTIHYKLTISSQFPVKA